MTITIRVFFHGLVSHISSGPKDRKNYSALVRAPGHDPYVNWSGNTGSPFEFTGKEAVLWFHLEPASGTADGSNPDFRDYLPPLSELAFKKVKEDEQVRKKKPNKHPTLGRDHSRAAGYIRYRAGTFTVASWYPEKGIYCHDGTAIREECVPEVTLLTLQFTGESAQLIVGEILSGGSVDGPLKPVATVATFTSDAVILVSNNPTHVHPPTPAPVSCDHPTYDDHWKHHLNMTDGNEISDMGKTTACAKYNKDITEAVSALLEPLRKRSSGFRMLMPGEIVCSNSGYP